MNGNALHIDGINIDYNKKVIVIEDPTEWTILLNPSITALSLDLDTNESEGKPMTEKSQTKLFMEVFNALSDNGSKDVDGLVLERELMNTQRFTEDSIKTLIDDAIDYGQIYEIKQGVYAKA